eukprot:TRINITY_DN2711_c0_g2_i1.p1 TRINITY_DN2711_c0_g2~~TRINITY_DN2711_c0_g2_i1.p1  ORF type:complete len:138 (+),score=28.38 TRINITY_DN2711_c0_g2_i1:111-524(+)
MSVSSHAKSDRVSCVIKESDNGSESKTENKSAPEAKKGLWSRLSSWMAPPSPQQNQSVVKEPRVASEHDFKIVILGYMGVGKSLVVQRLMGLKPTSTLPTVGCEISTRPIPRDYLPVPFQRDVCMRFVEVAHQEVLI